MHREEQPLNPFQKVSAATREGLFSDEAGPASRGGYFQLSWPLLCALVSLYMIATNPESAGFVVELL